MMSAIALSALLLLGGAPEMIPPEAELPSWPAGIADDHAVRRPCTPVVRGARIVACATPGGPRLDSPREGVLSSCPPRPARDASIPSPPPSREPREHGEEFEARGGSGASSRQRFLGGQR